MPITITPAAPGGIVGPGIGLELSSSFVGPLPAGSEYDILIQSIPEEAFVWEEHVEWQPGNRIYWLGTKTQGSRVTTNEFYPPAGATVAVTAFLDDTTGTVDTGSTTAVWQPTVGLGAQIALTPAVQASVLPDPRIDQILAAVVHQIQPQG